MINIQYINDNECLKWRLVRYLHPTDQTLRRITKADKDFRREIYFKEINSPFKIRDSCKIEKKNFIGILDFGYEKTSTLCLKKMLLSRTW